MINYTERKYYNSFKIPGAVSKYKKTGLLGFGNGFKDTLDFSMIPGKISFAKD